MKRNVKFSTYVYVISWVLPYFLAAFAVYGYQDGMPLWVSCIVGLMVIILFCCGFVYMPKYISADSSAIKIHRILKTKTIPMNDIESIMEWSPAMSAKPLLSSGGCYGYWGWFKEPSIGKYFAYYGKTSERFLVTLKSGRSYLLGCEKYQDLITYITQYIR